MTNFHHLKSESLRRDAEIDREAANVMRRTGVGEWEAVQIATRNIQNRRRYGKVR